MALGYLNDSEATQKAFIDGWFHSGDLGRYKTKNGEKWYYIVGRIKEIIIKGGVNLSPSAIEDAILKNFPEIEEVAVVGIPDERMGEEIASAIVLKQNIKYQISNIKKKILDKIREKKIEGLSEYEMPKKVFFMDSLPKTSTGKIQRVLVKKMISSYFVRQIDFSERDIFRKAAEIESERFGLPASLEDFRKRAKQGIVWGAFLHDDLVGSISCVKTNLSELKRIKTWKEVVNSGIREGDTLVCVAISVKSSKLKVKNSKKQKRDEKLLARKYIKEYVESGRDHVIAFHMKPKGGLSGAKVWKIVENGRPDDREAMGYNVLMKYPDLDGVKSIIFTKDASPAVFLIETALDYALKNGIKHVIAFSRPAGFKEYLNKQF